jgi:hypothetical protein
VVGKPKVWEITMLSGQAVFVRSTPASTVLPVTISFPTALRQIRTFFDFFRSYFNKAYIEPAHLSRVTISRRDAGRKCFRNVSTRRRMNQEDRVQPCQIARDLA